jgi:hypothetical protein
MALATIISNSKIITIWALPFEDLKLAAGIPEMFRFDWIS